MLGYTPQTGTTPPGRTPTPQQVPHGSYTPLAGTPPGRYTPPARQVPPGQVHPHTGTPLGRYTPAPHTVHAGIRSTSGWYASHWNTILLLVTNTVWASEILLSLPVFNSGDTVRDQLPSCQEEEKRNDFKSNGSKF